MGKSLVIVESPAKAKTINKYLGKDYVVKSSVGHVRDLPTSGSASAEPKKPVIRGIKLSESERRPGSQRPVLRMGINPTAGWQASLPDFARQGKVVSELQSLAAKADTIYLATDLDRGKRSPGTCADHRWRRQPLQARGVQRITKSAIQEAFAQPSELNIHRVNAQQGRRFLDRVVGYMVSPLLWKKLARGLSAGRVQSVAVRLIVDKEREIKAFVPVEFWDLNADLLTAEKSEAAHGGGQPQWCRLQAGDPGRDLRRRGGPGRVDYKVVNREDKPTGSKPSAPFITSTLQQAASTRLSFGVKKTMMMAQRLYEAGYITYMRTDSTNLSKEAVDAVREYIGEQYGAAYLPSEPNLYGAKANAQEAHEAIRPSSVQVTAEMLEGMEPDAMRLYDLIWRQFVACQMTPAQYDSST